MVEPSEEECVEYARKVLSELEALRKEVKDLNSELEAVYRWYESAQQTAESVQAENQRLQKLVYMSPETIKARKRKREALTRKEEAAARQKVLERFGGRVSELISEVAWRARYGEGYEELLKI